MLDVSNAVELRHLRYFLAVAEELHFGRAARRLGVAQPPVSQTIAALEAMLGVTLFNRTTRRVELTSAGRAIEKEARKIVALAARLAGVAQDPTDSGSATLMIGIVASASLGFVARLLRCFRERHTRARLHLSSLSGDEPHVTDLRSGVLDLAITRGPQIHSDLRSTVLLREPLMVALPSGHPLASRQRVSWSDLADCEFVLFPRATAPALFDSIISASAGAGVSLRVTQEAADWPHTAALVGAGVAAAFAPASAALFRIDGVAFVPLPEPRPHAELILTWHDAGMDAVAGELAEAAAVARAGLGEGR